MQTFQGFVQNIRDHSLIFRLFFYIVLVSSFFTFITTAIQLFSYYQKDVNRIHVMLDQIGESYIQGLTLSVWNIDTDLSRNLLIGILNLPDIIYVVVRDENDDIFASMGNPGNGSVISQKFNLEYTVQEHKEFIGTLEVLASLEGVYLRLREKVLVILGTQAVNTFLLSTFIILVVQYLITRHLRTMASYTRHLDLDKLDTPLELHRKKSGQGKPDELDQVVNSVNEMVTKLNKSSHEMQIQARMKGELDAAAKVQRSFTPENPPLLEDFELASLFYPAREVSGDYYDIIRINERYVALVVADVSGKGVSAAMYANIARVLLRDKLSFNIEPVQLLKSLHNSLKKEFRGNHFLTLSYVLIDIEETSITFANAGHEPLVLVKNNGSGYELLKPRGYPFCELQAELFSERITQDSYIMQSGDLIFCYTDGLTDVVNEKGEMYGEEKLYKKLEELHDLPVEQVLQRIYESLCIWQGKSSQTDDITMIGLKRKNSKV